MIQTQLKQAKQELQQVEDDLSKLDTAAKSEVEKLVQLYLDQVAILAQPLQLRQAELRLEITRLEGAAKYSLLARLKRAFRFR